MYPCKSHKTENFVVLKSENRINKTKSNIVAYFEKRQKFSFTIPVYTLVANRNKAIISEIFIAKEQQIYHMKVLKVSDLLRTQEAYFSP